MPQKGILPPLLSAEHFPRGLRRGTVGKGAVLPARQAEQELVPHLYTDQLIPLCSIHRFGKLDPFGWFSLGGLFLFWFGLFFS